MEERKKIIPNKLEMSEYKLYSRKGNTQTITRHELHSKEDIIPQTWSVEKNMPSKKKKKHLMYSKKFRTLFGLAIMFFVGSLIFAFVTFFQGGTTVSNNNIDIVVLGNSFVDGGEELPLQVKVANRNRTSLEIADILVEYSKGVGGTNDVVRERVSLGEIKSGDIAEDIITISVFGEQGSIRDITFTLEYRVNNSNAIFVKEYTYQITIATSPVDVLVEGPSTVISNQEFTTEVTVVQNSTEVSQRMMVVANYPSGFRFIEATPRPDFGNDTWFLGDLAPGAEKTIEIKGSIRASDGEERIITIISGSQNSQDEQEIGVQFTATPLQIEIGTPFISAELSSGQQTGSEITISSGETSFVIDWENELENSLNNVEIQVRFSGNGFDPNRVTVNQGFFDTNRNAIIWNQTNNNNFSRINPGQSGRLSFSLTPKTGVTNPTFSVAVDVSGVVAGQSTQPQTVTNVYNGTVRVSSDVVIQNNLYFTNGPFINSGNLPPKAGQETTYTIEWVVSSPSGTLDTVQLTADLPSYVTWKNEVFPQDERISFSSVNRRITWNAGNITPGTSGEKKVYFKVGITPSNSQVSTTPVVVSGGNLEAIDLFTGINVRRTFSQINTSLFKDTGYNQVHDRVIE